MLCQGRSNFEGLTHVATREVISRYVNYTWQVRGGGVDVKMCNKMIRSGVGALQTCPCLSPFLMAMTRLALLH